MRNPASIASSGRGLSANPGDLFLSPRSPLKLTDSELLKPMLKFYHMARKHNAQKFILSPGKLHKLLGMVDSEASRYKFLRIWKSLKGIYLLPSLLEIKYIEPLKTIGERYKCKVQFADHDLIFNELDYSKKFRKGFNPALWKKYLFPVFDSVSSDHDNYK